MPSSLRSQFRRWGLGTLAASALFLALPATGWALFSSASANTASISAATDWTPPTVSLVHPGGAVRGSSTLTATASDGETGVKNVAIAWAPSGTSSWTTLCTDPANPYSCSFNTTALPDDYVDLEAIATDNAGYSATALVEGVLVDNTAPSGSLDSIASPMSGVVTLTATATDAGSGVASVVIQRSLAGLTTWTTICTDTDAAPWNCRFDTTTVLDGSYDFRAIVTDVAGNTTTTSTVKNRIVSNIVSSVSVDNPGANLRGAVTLTANANASVGVASVRIQRQATGTTPWVDVCTDTTAPYACAWDTTTVTDGGYSLRAILTDTLSQTTTSAVVGPAQVDNSAARGVDVQSTSGGSAGKFSAGDTLTYTYSRAMKLTSILPGWDGTARAVVVRLRDGKQLGLTGTDDTVDVFTSSAYTTAVNLGAVDLKASFVKDNKTVPFNATMTQNGTTITLTLGTAVSNSGDLQSGTSASMIWTPSALALDTTNIACSPAPVTETGSKDRDF
jgi:hypothetical protein